MNLLWLNPLRGIDPTAYVLNITSCPSFLFLLKSTSTGLVEPQHRAAFHFSVPKGTLAPRGRWRPLPLQCPWLCPQRYGLGGDGDMKEAENFLAAVGKAFGIAQMASGTGAGGEKGDQLSHVRIALKTKYLHLLETVSLQTDPNERCGSKHPQMKGHLYCSSVVAASQ